MTDACKTVGGDTGAADRPPERLWHERLRKFESFDRVELAVVPRYKTSGLSGDEWRQHVAIRFFFKGELVHEDGSNNMESALLRLGHIWVAAQEPIPQRVIEIEKDRCDQPSCVNPAVGRFRLKKLFSAQGEAIDAADTYGSRYRQFCRVHLRRGDCSREDADTNYEPLDGVGPEQSSNVIESPAACMVVGPTDLEDLPAALQAAIGKPSA